MKETEIIEKLIKQAGTEVSTSYLPNLNAWDYRFENESEMATACSEQCQIR